MATKKLDELTALATPDSSDLLLIQDVSDTTDSAEGTSKKILYSDLDIPDSTADLVALGAVSLNDTQTLTNKTLTAPKFADGGFIADTNGNELLVFDSKSSAVNHIAIENEITGENVALGVAGDDTNISLTLTAKGTGKVRIDGGIDLNLGSDTANIQVNDSDPKRTMYVPASAMYPSTTAPCASLAQVESSTNDVNIKVLDFDGSGSSKEYAEFGIQSPSYWDAGTITAQFIWYATAGSGTVNWEIQGLALSDDDALDTAYGTLQEVTDTLLAIGDVHITAETSALTIAGSPVAGDWLQFKIARDPANDTNASDARLMGVRIRFTTTKYNDN